MFFPEDSEIAKSLRDQHKRIMREQCEEEGKPIPKEYLEEVRYYGTSISHPHSHHSCVESLCVYIPSSRFSIKLKYLQDAESTVSSTKAIVFKSEVTSHEVLHLMSIKQEAIDFEMKLDDEEVR